MKSGRVTNDLVRLRPRDDTVYLSQGRTVLACDRDGFIRGGADHGLFAHQTRLLARYRYLINGEEPEPVAAANVEQHSWLGYYICLSPDADQRMIQGALGPGQEQAEQTVELRLSRTVGEGMHEDVDLTNFTARRTGFRLELELDADFADLFETRKERRQQGELQREWRQVEAGVWELNFDYRAEHAYSRQGNAGTARIHRGAALRVEHADAPPSYAGGRIAFMVELAPHGTWHACVKLTPFIDGQTLPVRYGCHALRGEENEFDRRRHVYLSETTEFSAPGSHTLTHVVLRALEQARRDLAAMRLYDRDRDERAWVTAAGLPVYLSVFGRDTLTAAWQSLPAGPEIMRGTLAELAATQAEETNDWRDAQPGRMIHQIETGPLAVLNFDPRALSYSTVTPPALYPFALSELWHWTGDKDLIRQFLSPALKGLKWLDECTRSGGGFYWYRTRSEQGVKHQAWKDSDNAIVDEQGRLVEPPIAACDQQAYVYVSKLHFSEVLWWLDEKEHARRLYHEAEELKQRFNEAFWMEDEQYVALGLGPDARPVKAITSNPGHCLAAGIIDEERVRATADRMLADDLFTGWGVRTLSSRNPAFNPYSYHLGSVWPVEHGTFAIAFLRYGLIEHLHRVTRAMFEAAALFDFCRLPELFGGHARDDEHPFPALYPRANSPQAWSASAVFSFAQALCGVYPYAPLKLLLLDPHLPDWLPEMTLNNLRVGEASATVRFFRRADGETDYEVKDVRGTLHVLRQPSPWSLTAGWAERVQDALKSLLPGH
jgi:glycogen debranching enzyme